MRPLPSATGWMCSNIQCDSAWRTISGVRGSLASVNARQSSSAAATEAGCV